MQSGTNSRSLTHLSCQQLSHPSIQLNCSDFDTQDRQHIFSVTTKEAVVDANFWHLSFLSGRVCVRSTLRRYAMATPASVHCMSRQLVFGDLSCTWFRGRFGTLGTMSSSPSIASSRTGSCAPPGSTGSGFSGLTGSDPAGNPTRGTIVSVLGQWHRISLVSSRFHVDVVHIVLFVRNCATSVLRISQLLLEPSISFLRNIRTFVKHVTFVTIQNSDSTHRRVFCNRQQWFIHRRLNTSNSKIGSPIVATLDMHSLATFDKFNCCCTESEITVTRNRLHRTRYSEAMPSFLHLCRLQYLVTNLSVSRFVHLRGFSTHIMFLISSLMTLCEFSLARFNCTCFLEIIWQQSFKGTHADVLRKTQHLVDHSSVSRDLPSFRWHPSTQAASLAMATKILLKRLGARPAVYGSHLPCSLRQLSQSWSPPADITTSKLSPSVRADSTT